MFDRSNISRRKLLSFVGTTGITGLAGCGGQSPTEPETASQETDSPPLSEAQSPDPGTLTDTPTETSSAADFDLGQLQLPDQITQGEIFDISVRITNVGGKADQTTVNLELGDTSLSQEIELPPAEGKLLTFKIDGGLNPDTYRLSITENQTGATISGEIQVERRVLELPWSQLPGPPGGPVKDIEASAANPDYLYAITQTAGLYASSDGGESWIQGPSSEHHGTTITSSPHDPKVARSKINWTTDGGRTWLGGATDPHLVPAPDTWVNQYEYDPFDEEVIFAGTNEGIYRTADGGETWTQVDIPIDIENESVTWIDTASEKEGIAYAAFYSDATVVRTSDHGATWEPVTGADDMPNNNMRGLVSERTGQAAYVCVDNHGVYRAGDGQPRKVAPNIESPYFLYYDGPTLSADDERLYFHAYSLENIENDDIWSDMQLYEYDATIDETQTVDIPENPASVTAHPTKASTLFFGGWSWVWKSTDAGKTWTDLSNKFVDRYLTTVGTNHARSGTIIPGSACSTGVSVSHDHGKTWQWKRSGLDPFHKGGPRHYEEHYVMQADAMGDRIYVTTAAGLLISKDNGKTWRLKTNVPEYDTHGIDHYHGLGVDPNDRHRVFIGTGLGRQGKTNEDTRREPNTNRPSRIWMTTDGGESWRERTTGFPSHERTVIQDILVSDHDGSKVYVATNSEDYIAVGKGKDAGTGFGIFRSTNAGRQWEKLSTPFSNVHSITQDADDSEKLFASSKQGVYRSLDGGEVWEQVLPKKVNTKALLAHPNVADLVFAGIQFYDGYWDLFVSEDGGRTWAEGNLTIQVGRGPDSRQYDGIDLNAGYRPDHGDIMDLSIDPEKSHLVAATRGASLWRCDISEVSTRD